MAFDLAAMTRRARNPRRREIVFRRVRAPAIAATDLYQVFQPVLAEWEKVLPAVVAEYERTLAQMTTDSPIDVRVTLDRTDGVVAQLVLTIRSRLARWAERFEARHRQRWTAAVLAATGVDLRTVIGPEGARMTLETVIERNVTLVRNVSEQARQRIADAVYRGFTTRATATDIAKELRDAVAMGRRRARNIAADQVVKLASALDQERRREAGIDTFEWIHSGKLHFRVDHLVRDGRRYSDANPPPEMPGELPFCGCTSRAVLVLA